MAGRGGEPEGRRERGGDRLSRARERDRKRRERKVDTETEEREIERGEDRQGGEERLG